MNRPNANRVVRVAFSPDVLLLALSGSAGQFTCTTPMPDDAEYAGIAYDSLRNEVVLFVRSSEFGEVEPGSVPPGGGAWFQSVEAPRD